MIQQVNMHKNLNVNKYTKEIYTRIPSQDSSVQSSSQYHHPTTSNVMSSNRNNFTISPNRCPISPLDDSENLPKITRILSTSSQNHENAADHEWGQNPAFVFEEASQDTKITSTPGDPAAKSNDLCETSSGIIIQDNNCNESNNSCTSPASNNITSSSSVFSEIVNQVAQDVTESLSTEHTATASEEQWICTPCGITFPDNIMYGLHTACHSVHQPYRCNICGKLCRDRYDFTFHVTMGKHEGN